MSPRAPITSGIVSVFILIVSVSRSLYLESFSVIFIEVFLSDGRAIRSRLISWLSYKADFFSFQEYYILDVRSKPVRYKDVREEG